MTISNLQIPSLKSKVSEPSIWEPNVWVSASWESFVAISESPEQTKSSCYYYQNRMRIETMGIGPSHAIDHTLITLAIGLFCMSKGIPIRRLTNASYRRTTVDVETATIVAFSFQDKNTQVRTSLVLPGLEISILEQALRDRRTQDDSQIMAMLLKRFQA